MKRILTLLSFVALVVLASCANHSYTCVCSYPPTYLGPHQGQANLVETSTVKARAREQGDFKCSDLEGKYNDMDWGIGTCVLQ